MKSKFLVLGCLPFLAIGAISSVGNLKTKENSTQMLASPVLAANKKVAKYEDRVTYYDIPLAENAITVDRGPYYFERLGSRHGLDGESTNGYVAIQIFLGWCDTWNDSYVPEKYDVPTEEAIDPNAFYSYEPKGFSVSPGTDDYSIGRNMFYEHLKTQYGENIFGYSKNLNMKQLKNVLKRYLDDQGRSYTIEHSEGNFNDNRADKAYRILTETLNYGNPCICRFNGRFVVAYAYNSEFVWFHDALGRVGATPLSGFHTTWNTTIGKVTALGITNMRGGLLAKSNNYIDTVTGYVVNRTGWDLARSQFGANEAGMSNSNYDTQHSVSYDAQNIHFDSYYRNVAKVNNRNRFVMSYFNLPNSESYIEFWCNKRLTHIDFKYCYDSSYSNTNYDAAKLEFWQLKRETDGSLWWVNYQDISLGHYQWYDTSIRVEWHNYCVEDIIGFRLILKRNDNSTNPGVTGYVFDNLYVTSER